MATTGGAQPQQKTLQGTAPATAATVDYDQTLGESSLTGTVVSASYTPEAAITGAASPASRTLTIVNKGASGAGTTVLATLAFTAGVNGVAFDEKEFTVAGGAEADEGDIIAFVSTHVGATGLADPGGLVQVVLDNSAQAS